ncbi:hypothetical protein N431DRAFT_423829 [Stipitochalara longipes BDJ]|nr:hypothetical protein N431DRAFT_423829 [Stipitochalara longipes BDJ]
MPSPTFDSRGTENGDDSSNSPSAAEFELSERAIHSTEPAAEKASKERTLGSAPHENLSAQTHPSNGNVNKERIANLPHIATEEEALQSNQVKKSLEENESAAATQPAPAGNEWRSWKLHWLWMAALLLVEAGTIIAIIYLERRSATNNGIAAVPQVSASLVSSHFAITNIWKYGLLWTALPSLLITIYRIMWDMVVSATADWQPFVDLLPQRGKEARNATRTIMLDYRSYPSFFNWWYAFWNHHIILGFSMILSLLLSIGVVPLSAHLFVTALSQSNSTLPLTFTTAFEDSLPANASLQSSIDLATACRVYGANPPPWMTTEYAFEQFTFDAATKSGNVTANTYAYSAYLDCQAFSPSTSTPEYSGDSGDGLIAFTFNDRGCAVSIQVGVLNNTAKYATTWHTSCSGSTYGRLGIFAGIYDDTSPFKMAEANYSLISCIPSYWIKYGSVTVSYQPSNAPQFLSFTATNSTNFQPELHQTFEDTIGNYKFLDGSGTIQTDTFALSVLSCAETQNPTSPITPSTIQNSIEDVLTTVYAGLVANLLLPPANTPRTGSGNLSTPVTRLYVVTPVAYTIATILLLIFVCNVLLFGYVERHHSILHEQPTGLLGMAPIVERSDLPAFVAGFRESHRDEYQIREFVEENYTTKNARCYMEESTGKIRIEGLKERIPKK